jgi:hypothetical protein
MKTPGSVIRRAIQAQRDRGIRIVDLNFGVTIIPYPTRYICAHGWCDPVGAVILWFLPRPEYGKKYEDLAAELLGQSRAWVESLISGYNDTDLPEEFTLDRGARRLGRQLRREYQLWRVV